MRLALAAGRLDVDAVLRGLSLKQLTEWEAFERIEGGIGARADWYQIAQLCAMYAEAHRDSKRRSQPFTAADFLPFVEKPKFSAKAFRAQFAPLVKKQSSKR